VSLTPAGGGAHKASSPYLDWGLPMPRSSTRTHVRTESSDMCGGDGQAPPSRDE